MLLRGGTLATLDPPTVEAGDLRIQGDRIVERRASLVPRAGEEVCEVEGALVFPGLVNAHTHLYGSLARGMPPPSVPPSNFAEILKRVWWRLDRALSEEEVYASAVIGGLEAIRSGTTLLFDHHSSPSFIKGSLQTLRLALEEVGLRSVLCYEITDRNGMEGRDLGIDENLGFQPSGNLTRRMVGAHASFTLSAETLERVRVILDRSGAWLHVHMAEDALDVEDCRARHGSSLCERFKRHDLLRASSIFAHCVHLTLEELEEIHKEGAWVVHNPRSNMNNAVGYAQTAGMGRAALGTDGMDQDLWAESRAAFLRMREAGRTDAVDATLHLLAGGHRLAATVFGLPFGGLTEGAPADLAVLDYPAPTPLNSGNLGAHILFGIDRSHVSSVMVAGRWVVRERVVQGVELKAALSRARSAARNLWQRMEAF